MTSSFLISTSLGKKSQSSLFHFILDTIILSKEMSLAKKHLFPTPLAQFKCDIACIKILAKLIFYSF